MKIEPNLAPFDGYFCSEKRCINEHIFLLFCIKLQCFVLNQEVPNKIGEKMKNLDLGGKEKRGKIALKNVLKGLKLQPFGL